MSTLAEGTKEVRPPSDAPEKVSATTLWSGHIGALDGIRGLGVLLVLFYHYGASAGALGFDNVLLRVSAIGWSGVDLFFVLSGFLITGILFDSKGKEGYFRNFYARRTLRIFPLYYLAALLVILLSAVWSYDVLGGLSPVWILLYVGNFQMAFEGGGSILDHFWSLAIEEQFYLIWPMVVLALSRKQLMLVAAGMIVFSPLLRTLLVLNDVSSLSVYVLTPARMDGLALGALIALAVRGPGGIDRLLPWAWGLGIAAGLGFAAIVLARSSFSSSDPVILTAGISLLLTFYASLLILALTFRPIKVVMELPVMRWFGKYSYGLYVWHPIVNMILLHSPLTEKFGEMNPAKAILLLVVAFLISLLVALASYNLFETRFLKLKNRFH